MGHVQAALRAALALLIFFDFGVEWADDLDGLRGQRLRSFTLVMVVPDKSRLLWHGKVRGGLVSQKPFLGESMFSEVLRQQAGDSCFLEGR